jgi:alanyl-tRNA synthetase
MTNPEQILDEMKTFLVARGFSLRESIGLLDPRFGYPFSPSATHQIIDDVVVGSSTPQPLIKFAVIPDRSLRMYDIEKIGISNRHLSFFETLAFGYAGARDVLPKEQACKEVYDLMIHLGLDRSKLLITCLDNVKAEGTEIDNKEDAVFFRTWRKLLGTHFVKLTAGRRNLFYSRIKGNPGGTGCEIYYRIGDNYIEIGSQVNYKFKFTGGLERTVNAAVPEGFGFERLLMAMENKQKISDVSLISPIKECVRDYLRARGEDDQTINLYDENITSIADSIRAIAFVLYDAKGDLGNLTGSQRKILHDFRKNLNSEKSEVNYLGVYDKSIYSSLVDAALNLYVSRYPALPSYRSAILNFIES